MKRREFVRSTLMAGAAVWLAPRGGLTSQTPADRLKALGKRNVGVHDPSTIVKAANGEYWIFRTGRGVPSLRSRDLLTWEAGPPVMAAAPEWVATAVPDNRNNSCWAPDVIHFGDRYLLYYSVSTFGKQTSAIGLMSNRTLVPTDPDYKWVDEGLVIQSDPTVDFNAIDPAVAVDAAGNLWLSLGSFWKGIKLIALDKTGRRSTADTKVYAIAYHREIEASAIYRHGAHYYLFVSWGRCCRGLNSTYDIRVGRSAQITGPYLDKNGVDLMNEGGTVLLETDGPFIGPGHAGIFEENGKSWFSCHYYDGTTPNGASMLSIRPMHWAADGWPQVDEYS
jgi:arabinan endo-1,5-alpha-L-arabinosidase